MVFEVLTFAFARQIIIDHSRAIDNLYGLSAIAILFAIRKYLMPKESRFVQSSPDPQGGGSQDK